MTAALFATVGALLGVGQVVLLRRAALHLAGNWGVLARLVALGLMLVLAARAGHLLVASCGWAAAFAITTALVYRRWS